MRLQSAVAFELELNRVSTMLVMADDCVKRDIESGKKPDLFLQQTVQQASITLLSANLEGFLKELGKEFASETSIRKIPFEYLPPGIRRCHLAFTPDWIVHRRPQLDYDDDDDYQEYRRVAKCYGSPIMIETGYELLGESYGDALANPGYNSICDIMGRMDISFSAECDQSSNPTIKTCYEWLPKFIRLRNKIAHGGGRAVRDIDSKPYILQLRELSQFIEVLIVGKIQSIESYGNVISIPPNQDFSNMVASKWSMNQLSMGSMSDRQILSIQLSLQNILLTVLDVNNGNKKHLVQPFSIDEDSLKKRVKRIIKQLATVNSKNPIVIVIACTYMAKKERNIGRKMDWNDFFQPIFTKHPELSAILMFIRDFSDYQKISKKKWVIKNPKASNPIGNTTYGELKRF